MCVVMLRVVWCLVVCCSVCCSVVYRSVVVL